MFYQTSFLLLVIVVTAVITRRVTAKEYNQSMYGLNRFTDRTLKRKFFIAKVTIIFLVCLVLVLWSRLTVNV
ncbi:MAG: hypothetical protein ACJAUY_000644 [Cognaticolwellia sp.]|jgi:hypothetical protein